MHAGRATPGGPPTPREFVEGEAVVEWSET